MKWNFASPMIRGSTFRISDPKACFRVLDVNKTYSTASMVFSSADFQAWAQTDQFSFLNVLQVKVWLDNGLRGFYGLPVWQLASVYQLVKIEGKNTLVQIMQWWPRILCFC